MCYFPYVRNQHVSLIGKQSILHRDFGWITNTAFDFLMQSQIFVGAVVYIIIALHYAVSGSAVGFSHAS